MLETCLGAALRWRNLGLRRAVKSRGRRPAVSRKVGPAPGRLLCGGNAGPDFKEPASGLNYRPTTVLTYKITPSFKKRWICGTEARVYIEIRGLASRLSIESGVPPPYL